MNRSVLAAILLSGFIVGSLDILLAFATTYIKNNNITPDKVLRFIASGVFDKKAFVADNTSMVYWGLLFHYIIALGFTAIFYFIFPKIKWMAANKIITGILYGIIVWAIMSFIVLPLSSTPGERKFEFKSTLQAIVILIVAIGLPLSFFAGKFYSKKRHD